MVVHEYVGVDFDAMLVHRIAQFHLPGEGSHALQTICCCNGAFHLADTSRRENRHSGFKRPFWQSHRTKSNEQSHRHRWHLPQS